MMVFPILVTIVSLAAAGSIAYLLLHLIAAVLPGPRSRRAAVSAGEAAAAPLRFGVVIPAHDEELVLAATLESLRRQDYPREQFEVIVVADNCTDRTAAIAREYGATVLERVDPNLRGKGYALNWAFRLLLERPSPAAAYAIIDADTEVAPDFLSAMVARSGDRDGCWALQGRYGVSNRGEGWRAELMGAALDLVNHVRPLGSDRLGLGVSLKGNGMAFSRALLERVPWQGRSITEDLDYGLDLLERHGIRVGYVPEARVRAQMPTSGSQAESQRARWESGRYRLLRERAWPLLKAGVRRGDVRLIDAATGLVIPPLAELCALLLLWLGLLAWGYHAGWLTAPAWGWAFAASAFGLVLYVVGGLAAAGASRQAYLGLLLAPVYTVWKLMLYGSMLFRALMRGRRSQPDWVRTARTAIPPEGP